MNSSKSPEQKRVFSISTTIAPTRCSFVVVLPFNLEVVRGILNELTFSPFIKINGDYNYEIDKHKK